MPDYDECQEMLSLVNTHKKISQIKRDATEQWTQAEIILNKGIIKNNISDNLAWKKQVLELCKLNLVYIKIMEDYYSGKGCEKQSSITLKTIENHINVIKKIKDSTPEFRFNKIK